MLNRRDTLIGLGTLVPGIVWPRSAVTYRDIRSFPGIHADGKTDDFLALQTAFKAARENNIGILWPAGIKTFVQFSQEHPYMFIEGELHLRGEDRKTSGIAFHCDYDMGKGHAPLFCFGIASIGSRVNKISGEIEQLGWFLESGSKKFERCCMVYGAENFLVQDCLADFRSVTWPVKDSTHPNGYSAGGWWCSNVQPDFARGQTRDKNVRFVRNLGLARAEYQNAESIGFSNTDGLQYIDNNLTGWADDLAAHDCSDVLMQGNVYKSVSGRLYLEGCQNARIIGNTAEPIEQPISGGFLGPYRRFIHADMVINTYQVGVGAAATERPNSDIVIADNIINLPANSFCAGAISVWGLQNNLQITNNKIYNNGARSPVTAIAVSSGYRKGWIGPIGNPDRESDGAIRMRNVTIRGNQLLGTGWLPDDGTIGISAALGGKSEDIQGPITVDGNMAGNYYMPYKVINFNKNTALPTSKNPYRHVAPELRGNAAPSDYSR